MKSITCFLFRFFMFSRNRFSSLFRQRAESKCEVTEIKPEKTSMLSTSPVGDEDKNENFSNDFVDGGNDENKKPGSYFLSSVYIDILMSMRVTFTQKLRLK